MPATNMTTKLSSPSFLSYFQMIIDLYHPCFYCFISSSFKLLESSKSILLSLWQLEKTSRKGATSSFKLLESSKSIFLPPWQQEKTSRKGATTRAVAKTSCPFLLHLILIMKKMTSTNVEHNLNYPKPRPYH